MRFISRYGRFRLQVRPLIQEAYATGMTRTLQYPLYADFAPAPLSSDERALAVGHWSFNGLYQELDQTTTVEPDYRIGVFDSLLSQAANGWSDEDRIVVENELIRSSELHDDCLPIVEPRVPPPWPNYDRYGGNAKALLRKLIDEGHDLERTLAYERQNQERPDVIAELSTALQGDALLEEEEVLG